MEAKNSDGLTAYDILRLPNCPIKLPVARSMTQASIDYKHIEPRVFEWYEKNKAQG